MQIRNAEVSTAVDEQRKVSGYFVFDASGKLVPAEIPDRLRTSPEVAAKPHAAIQSLLERFKDIPRVGELLTDGDLYDEDGMPTLLS